MVLVSDLVGNLDGFETLHTLGIFTDVEIDLMVKVQDKAVSFVQRVEADGHLVTKQKGFIKTLKENGVKEDVVTKIQKLNRVCLDCWSC